MAISVKYLPFRDSERVLWLMNFKEKATVYAAVLGLSADTVQQLETDTAAFHNLVMHTEQVRNYSEAVTAFRNLLRGGSQPLGSPPPPPAPLVLPSGAQSDIFGRVRRLVQTIKSHPDYTESIGDDLRIIAPKTADDINAWKPRLNVTLAAGAPVIKWKKGKSHGIKLWVNRGGGFEFLAINTIPNFTDHHPLPPKGQSAIWQYQAAYLLKDQTVGQHSDIIEVTVTGGN